MLYLATQRRLHLNLDRDLKLLDKIYRKANNLNVAVFTDAFSTHLGR